VEGIIEMIVKEDVLKQIFTRGNTHAQLVQRSEKLIRLFMTKGLVTDRQMIWEATEMNDDDQEIALYKVLSGIAGDMKLEDRSFFLDKVFLVPKG
jgi:hypothetical protein